VLDSLGVSTISINNSDGFDWVISKDVNGNQIIKTENKSIVIQRNDLSVISKMNQNSTIIIDQKVDQFNMENNITVFLSSHLTPWELRDWKKSNNELYSLSDAGLILTR
jgi:hypothetical protein